MAAADINSNQYSIVTNYKPEHQNKEIFLEGLIDTTRLPVFFPFRRNEAGHYIADGAAISNMPIDLVIDHDCDVVVILGFRCAGEGVLEKEYNYGYRACKGLPILLSTQMRKKI